MKRVVLLIAVSFTVLSIFSQDLIIGKNLKRTKCEITGEDNDFIYTKINRNGTHINTFISRGEVKSYHYDYFIKKAQARDSLIAHRIYDKSLTIGFLNGGGSLIGLDVEFALINSVGFQVGSGYFGFGAGINYHFRPDITSSFVSLQYWHQGVIDTYSQSLIGPSFVFRAKKIFTAQIGIGFALEKGPAWPENMEQPPVMLVYSIGMYFPN
jgi:hypothetical protein